MSSTSRLLDNARGRRLDAAYLPMFLFFKVLLLKLFIAASAGGIILALS